MKKIILGLLFGIFPFSLQASLIETYDDFSRVPIWAVQATEALLKAKIIRGDALNLLRADHTINRAEFCKILVNATEKGFTAPLGKTFSDVRPEHWFFPYIEIAYSHGWVKGYGDGTFHPEKEINRAEIAKLLVEAFGFKKDDLTTGEAWYAPYQRAIEKNNLWPFQVTAKNFEPSRTPSRAEVFDQIYRTIRIANGSVKPEDSLPSVTIITEKKDASYQKVSPEFSAPMTIIDNAGTLEIKKSDDQPQKIKVSPGAKNIKVLELDLVARNHPVEIAELQLRRIGFGSFFEFGNLYLELNGAKITPKVNPKEDVIVFEFSEKQVLKTDTLFVLSLKTDISKSAEIGHFNRFVLYLPNWINASTNAKIGFFPFGGSDIEIK